MTEEKSNTTKSIRKSTVSGSMWSELGKLPPQAIEEEEIVLGAILLERDAIDIVAEWLPTEAFYKDEHKEIYQAVLNLYEDKSVIDLLTVTGKLRTLGRLEFAGGGYYLSELTNRVGSGGNLEYHARIIHEKYMLRQVIEIASQYRQDAFEETTNALELISKAQGAFNELGSFKDTHEAKPMATLVPQVFTQVKEAKEQPEKMSAGYSTGLKDLDELLGGGFHKSDMIIIAARPGQGKSAIMMSIATHMGIELRIPVAIFSMEMSALQLTARMVSGEAKINSKQLRSGRVNDSELQSILSNTYKLQNSPIYIDDTPSLTGASLYSKIKRYIKLYGIEVVFLDYLQIMEGPVTGNKQYDNREQIIGKISRTLKKIAREFDIPVIPLAQLSRAVEQRGKSKKPLLSDLKESGSIEQEADQVLFIYRPETYDIFETDEGCSTHGLAEISVGKNRHGDIGDIQLYYQAKYTKFMDYLPEHKVPFLKGNGNRMEESQENLPF